MLWVADTRELQELGRVDGATTKNNFSFCFEGLSFAVDFYLKGHRAGLGLRGVKNNTRDQSVGLQPEVASLQGWAQVGHRRAPTAAFMGGHVHGAKALLLVAVHIRGIGVASLLAGFDKCVVKRIFTSTRRHMQRTFTAAIVIATFIAGFGFLEVRQAVRVTPVGKTKVFSPSVVVLCIAPDIDHPVDTARAANGFTARAVNLAMVHKRFRL